MLSVDLTEKISVTIGYGFDKTSGDESGDFCSTNLGCESRFVKAGDAFMKGMFSFKFVLIQNNLCNLGLSILNRYCACQLKATLINVIDSNFYF